MTPSILLRSPQRASQLFLLLTALVGVLSWMVLASLEGHAAADLLAGALTVDLVVVLPALYFALVVRPRRWPWITVLPFILLCAYGTSWLLPQDHQTPLRNLRHLVAPLELSLLALIGWKAMRVVRHFRECPNMGSTDFPERLRRAAVDVVGVPRVAEILASEISLLYYGLASWFRRAEENSSAFTVHRKDSYGTLVVGILTVMGVELIPVHLLALYLSGPFLAWTMTLLTLYGALWIVGDYQALRFRPMKIGVTGLAFRLGLRWEAQIPWDQVISFRRLNFGEKPGKDAVTLVTVGQPAFFLETREAMTFRGFYGFRRKGNKLYFDVDQKETFEETVRTYLRGDLEP